MIKNTFLGLGPMSVEVVNSLDFFSKKYTKKIMLICSRNQIESSKLGGGYVNNFSTSEFSNFVKTKRNKLLIMSRDHCGPFKRDRIKKNKENLKKEIDNCKISLLDDIKNDFKILHIDTSECGAAKYEIAEELINFCNENAKINKLPFSVEKDFRVGYNCFINNYSIIEEIKNWIDQNNISGYVFLLSASSLSNLLIHQLYKHCDTNTYIDIGTTLNHFLGIDGKRGYLTGRNRKICIW